MNNRVSIVDNVHGVRMSIKLRMPVRPYRMNAIISAMARMYVALTVGLKYTRSIFPLFTANPALRLAGRTSVETLYDSSVAAFPSGVQ
jgi:hypothetical protein